MKTITLRDITQAIRKNGYKKAKRTFFGGYMGACAYGQAALNLDLTPDAISAGIAAQFGNIDANLPVRLNDRTELSMEEIAKELENAWEASLDIPFVVRSSEVDQDFLKEMRVLTAKVD